MMPYYMAMGATKEEFLWSTPNELASFEKAYKLKREINDEMAWLQGRYTLEALMTALSHFGSGLSGKRSTAEYLKEPIMQSRKVDENGSESNEIMAVFEMKQRAAMMEQQGLPMSPR